MRLSALFERMNRKGNTVILVLLVQYLLVFLIPSFAMFFIYTSTLNTIENELLEKNHMLLDVSKSTVEKGLSEVSMAFQQLENNPAVLNFKRIDRPIYGSNVIRAAQLQKALQNYGLQSELIYDYYIVYDKNGTVVGPNVIATMEDFFDICLKYESGGEEPGYEELPAVYRDKYMTFLPSGRVQVLEKELSAVTVIKPVTLLNRYQDITIIALLNDRELRRRIGSIDNTGRSSIYILDTDGGIITSSSFRSSVDLSDILNGELKLFGSESGNRTIQLNGEDILITYTAPSETGWRYVSVQPFSTVLAKADYIKGTIIVFIAADLVAGLLIITFLLYANGRPVKKLMNMAADLGNAGRQPCFSVYKPIQNAFANLEQKYESVSRKMDEQKSFLTVSFFERLYNGRFKAVEEAKAVSAHLGLDIEARFYTVALFCLNGYEVTMSEEILDELNFKRLILKERLSRLSRFGRRILLHDPDKNEVAMLILGNSQTPGEEREKIRGTIEEALKIVEGIEELDASVYIGSTCDQLIKIDASMNAARQCFNYGRAITEDSRVVWHEDISGVFTGYHYPREIENRLINCVLCGNSTDVAAILDEIYNENMCVRRLPPKLLQLLSHELCGTLLRMLDNGLIEKSQLLVEKLSGEIEAIVRINDAGLLTRRIKELFEFCCSMISGKKKERDIIKKVLEYLNQNYGKFDITLSSITEMFNISQTHLSKQFKEKTGFTVYEYLEKVRIEKACQLLLEKDRSVKEIAEKVGYVSSNTFCRAFKRLTGVSASEYREIKI